ncbi:hypothetical protein ACHAXM_011078 [Skeletonema potamos]
MTDPPSHSASNNNRRRRRLTKLQQIQRQRNRSSGNYNSNDIIISSISGSDPSQDYPRKLEQVLFGAEHNLQLERHTRLRSPPSLHINQQQRRQQDEEESLEYSSSNDGNSFIETVSLDSATASFMDTRSATPIDTMKNNLLRNGRSGSSHYRTLLFDKDDDDVNTNLDETVLSGYSSKVVVSEYTSSDNHTVYTRDTLQSSKDEDELLESTIYKKGESTTPRVRFDSNTKFGNEICCDDYDFDDDESLDTLDVIKNSVLCRPYWGIASTNNNCTGVGGMDDSDTIATRDTRSVWSTATGSILSGSRGDVYSTMDTMDSRHSTLPGWRCDDSVLNEVYNQNDDDATANVANPWVCATDFMGGIMDNIESTKCEEPITGGTISPKAKRSHGKRMDDISDITRGTRTANSTETDISLLTEHIKQIMAESARNRQHEEDIEGDGAMNVNKSASSNKTLSEKLDAVNRRRNYKMGTLMNEGTINKSYGVRFEAVNKSRSRVAYHQREEVGLNSSFWQGDGVWSSDQSTAFGTAFHSSHLAPINPIPHENADARARSANASNCWSAAIDASSGKTYYYNNNTRETSWLIPNGYNGSVRNDKMDKTSVQEQRKMSNVDLSRARTQNQRGGKVFIEVREGTIGSRSYQSTKERQQLDEKQFPTVPAVNAIRQVQRHESSQSPISQIKTSRKQESNQQHHHHPATTQNQEKKQSRRRRFHLFRKKSSKENTTSNTTTTKTKTSSSSSAAAVSPTIGNKKSYEVASTIDPVSPDRTVDTSLGSSNSDDPEYSAPQRVSDQITRFSC